MLFIVVLLAVFISGCDNGKTTNGAVPVLREAAAFKLDTERTAWLRNHLPNETVAYINLPTPWNYLFDAKADAMHSIQQLPAHIEQVKKIKQGAKDNYFQFIPTEYQGLTSLLFEYTQTSLEIAVINNSPSALLPTMAVGTRLQGLSRVELIEELNTLLANIDPTMVLEQVDQTSVWSFTVNQFPAFFQYDESNGQLLIYGGMGANQSKMSALWANKSGGELSKIQAMSEQADPSGLNMKMWVAAAKMYQMGQAFLPPEQKQVVTELGLDQMDYIWMGFESNQGQSALALHVMMPETGWRLMLPRAKDWFDVTMAGQPRSVIQVTLPTSEQIKQVIEKFDLKSKLSASDREDMKVWEQMSAELGFDFYDIIDAYHQQMIWIKDESGSWIAMKTKDSNLRQRVEKSFAEYFKIKSTSSTLDGVEIMQAHFSIYQKMFETQKDMPAEAAKIKEFLGIFKEHGYWYEEGDVIYMSQVPQVLAMKKNNSNQLSLSSWLIKNQGGNWDSAIFAYGKDIKHMPQDMYHYYLLLLQGLGDLAQVEVDLFTLPTAEQLNLPESGRINLVLSSDAEKVSLKFGYEYSMLEPILSGEGGLAVIATVGILAAYAVPAYRDYMVRAKIIEQLALAAPIKMAITEHWYTNESFDGLEMSLEEVVTDFFIDVESGTIVIELEGLDSAFYSEDVIYLEPNIEDGFIDWVCYGDLNQGYLPNDCR